jgi:CRP-like cAMP-binding protein
MAEARKLKDKAAELAARGKLEKAADVYRELVRMDPRDVGSLQRLAETLRRAGAIAEAIGVYRDVAERYARDGLLLKAIAIEKTVLELDPANAVTQAALASLSARHRTAPRAAQLPRPPAQTLSPQTLSDASTALDVIVAAAEQGVAEGAGDALELLDLACVELPETWIPEPVAPAPAADAANAAALPRYPIFSDLAPDAFVALSRGLALRRVPRGEPVIREGETGTSFFVVASGRVAVTTRDDRGVAVVVARLGEGEFFGEMALLSGAPRAATVTAEEPCELLELGARVLADVARQHPQLATTLRRFCRQRLLANAVATSPLFRPLSREDRRALLARFRTREVAAGDAVVREGEAADGMYVALEGTFDVVTRHGGAPAAVAELHAGDVFGEMSCLRKRPASASVVARRAGLVLRLPREDFDALASAYPQLLALVAELAEERGDTLDAIRSGRALYTPDGLVLI